MRDLRRYVLTGHIVDLSDTGADKDAGFIAPYASRIVGAVAVTATAITGNYTVSLENAVTGVVYGATAIGGAAGTKELTLSDTNNATVNAGECILAQVVIGGATGGAECNICLVMEALEMRGPEVVMSWCGGDVSTGGSNGRSFVPIPFSGIVRKVWVTHPTVATGPAAVITVDHKPRLTNVLTRLADMPIALGAGAVVETGEGGETLPTQVFEPGDVFRATTDAASTNGGNHIFTILVEKLDPPEVAAGEHVLVARAENMGVLDGKARIPAPYAGAIMTAMLSQNIHFSPGPTLLQVDVNGTKVGTGFSQGASVDIGDTVDMGPRFSDAGVTDPRGVPFALLDDIGVISDGGTTGTMNSWCSMILAPSGDAVGV